MVFGNPYITLHRSWNVHSKSAVLVDFQRSRVQATVTVQLTIAQFQNRSQYGHDQVIEVLQLFEAILRLGMPLRTVPTLGPIVLLDSTRWTRFGCSGAVFT